jgi:hypothetical protein
MSNPTSPRCIHTAFLIVGLMCLAIINILFIVDIELTLRRNKGNQTNGDDKWGFGQVLALLLLVVPLRDAWSALRDIRDKLKGVQEQFEELVERECKATGITSELKRLMDAGANLAEPKEENFDDYLQQSAYYGRLDLVQYFQNYGGDDKLRKFAATSHTYSTDNV